MNDIKCLIAENTDLRSQVAALYETLVKVDQALATIITVASAAVMVSQAVVARSNDRDLVERAERSIEVWRTFVDGYERARAAAVLNDSKAKH